jgi:tetratricopeptide (TPR) repeat protein
MQAAIAYDEALTIWRDIGDQREIANALYNAAYADLQPILLGGVGDQLRSHARMEEALGMFRAIGDRVGEGNAMWGLGSLDYFEAQFEDAERWFVASTEVFRGTTNRTMQAWSEKMLGTTLLKLDRTDEALAALVPALRHFYDAGDLSGVTLLLDDLSVVALSRKDLPRAARLRGAARRLQASTGTELAIWVDRTRPDMATTIPAADLERYGAEGAAMSFDEVVAYALGEDPGSAPEAGAASSAASAGDAVVASG